MNEIEREFTEKLGRLIDEYGSEMALASLLGVLQITSLRVFTMTVKEYDENCEFDGIDFGDLDLEEGQ